MRVQDKYGSLTPESPSVQQGQADPLPTWSDLQHRIALARKLTVRDAWGLMLSTVPREGPAGWLCGACREGRGLRGIACCTGARMGWMRVHMHLH